MSVWDESPLPPPVAGTPAAPPPSGPPPGSRPGPPSGDEPSRRFLGLPVRLAAILALLICAGAATAIGLSIDSDSAPPPEVAEPTITEPTAGAATTTAAPQPTTTSTSTSTTSTSTPSSTAADTTTTVTPTTVAPTTVAPTTVAPTTVAPTTTTGAPVSPEPSSVVGSDGQRLTVTPRRGSCGSGADCLVVAFTIDGFATRPRTFVCEFASGVRYEFRFSGDGVDQACATSDVPDSIVVEVGGLRSDPVTTPG